MKVLVVDDSKAVHALLEDFFEGTGTSLQHVFNGKEAIAAVTETGFNADLILLDWEMPALSGIDALPVIRKSNPTVSILMMTSKNSISNIAEALEKGATDYVMKPYTKDILIGKIMQVTGKEVA